jgi:hypothetical protein
MPKVVHKLKREHFKEQNLCICGSFKSAKDNWVRKFQISNPKIRKSEKYMVCKSQISKMSYLQKVCKSEREKILSANLWIFDLQGFFVDAQFWNL